MLQKEGRAKAWALTLAVAVALTGASAASADHPGPQPRPGPSTQTISADGMTTYVETPTGMFPESDPFENPPGTNFLDTVYSNMLDGNGVEMPNTLPSTPDEPYNLHPEPVVTAIDKTSPTDDLDAMFDRIREAASEERRIDREAIDLAIDILEGNPIADRGYSGFPLLHYNGPEKVKAVEPIYDADGNTIGGNVDIHQIWYDSHIESDTALVDPSAVLDVPWTITYTVEVLNRGHDDFAPFVMYVDDPALSMPGMPPMPHVAMDQTFFPMEEGTRSVFQIAMTPGKYYNLTYHWGWRIHPPRVQVVENARKMIGGKTLPEWEIEVFGEAPSASEEAKLRAISMIGDLAPAKRMWRALQGMTQLAERSPRASGAAHVEQILDLLDETESAFAQWRDRTKLPDGVALDPESDLTMLYVNNTLYGQMKDMVDDAQVDFPQWVARGTTLKVKLYNGDYFEHAYMNVDFGGSRGWENTFHSTIDVGGAGPWFTFGRVHWWVNAGAPPVGLITVPAAQRAREMPVTGRKWQADIPGEHNVHITFNFEPSRRLRIYQFDPLHHDVAVWSVH
jgi:hypothetical protein